MYNIIILSTKNYKNNSSIYANTGKFDKIEVDDATINNNLSNSYLNENYYNKQYVNSISGNLFTNYYIKVDVDSKIAGSYNLLIHIMFKIKHLTKIQLNYD